MSKRNLERMIKGIIYFSFITPLIFLPKLFIFPYIVPKAIFLRSLIILSFVLLVVLCFKEINKKSFKAFWTPLSVVLTLFFVSMFVSTFVGVDWSLSFWSSQERMLGSFMVVHYFLLFLVCRKVFRTWLDWSVAFLIFGGAGMLVVSIGLVQKINPEFLLNMGQVRVVSTLGNTIFLGGLGLFMFFIGVLSYFKEKAEWRKWCFLTVSFFGLLGVLISGTRGTFLGVLTGLFVVLILYLFKFRSNKRVKFALISIIGLCILFSGVFFSFRNNSFVRSLPVVGDIVQIDISKGTAKTRLMAWEVAIEGWRDKPLFGWGPNNYYYAFNKHYNPDFLKISFQETWFDNAHNIVLNMLTTQGALGFVSYLGIFGVGFWSLCKIRNKDEEMTHIYIFGVGFLCAHLVHNLFVFENITSYLYFFLFLAFVDRLYQNFKANDNSNDQSGLDVRIPPIYIAVAILFALVFVWFTNVNVALANTNAFKSRQLLSQGKDEESIKMYKKSISFNSPYRGDIDWDYAMDILYVIPRVYSYDEGIARELYDIAVNGMAKVVEKHPDDVRARLAYMDLLRSGGMVLFEIEGSEDLVRKNLEIAEKLSPQRQQVEYSKVTFLAGTGEIDLALELAKKIVERDPGIADGYYTLARLYSFNSQFKEILVVLDEAINHGVRFTFSEQQIFVAESYEREGRFRDALYWYDQAYKSTGNERIAYKRDELSNLTKKLVPKRLEDFFQFE